MHKITRLRSAGRSADYYQKDDYYSAGEGEQKLVWGGKGAAALGLSGEVKAAELRATLAGINPAPEGLALSKLEALMRDGLTEEEAEKQAPHAPGWDETFSAPKGFSLVDLVAGDDRFLAVHLEAVAKSLEYVEQHLSVYRERNPDGSREEIVAGELTFAQVTHALSRELDPQRHTHALVQNFVPNEDGEYRALETKDIYKYSQLIGRIYQNYAREGVQALGFDTVSRPDGTFDIAGISEAQKQAFSKRTAILEDKFESAAADRGGPISGEEKQFHRQANRPEKGEGDLAVLLPGWQREACESGIDFAGIRERADEKLKNGDRGRMLEPEVEGKASKLISKLWGALDQEEQKFRSAKGAVEYAIELNEERTAVFRSHDVLDAALLASRNAFPLADYEKAIASFREKGILIDADRSINAGLTTAKALAYEAEIVAAAKANLGTIDLLLNPDHVEARLTPEGLEMIGASKVPTPAQHQVITSILTSTNGVDVLQGHPGVGKTTMFQIVGRAVDNLSDGQTQLKGLGPSHMAIQAMNSEAGVPARTVSSFIGTFERAVDSHNLEALKAEYGGHWVVVDEASMLSNKAMAKILGAKAALGIEKLIISGDQRQLSSPEAGAPHRLLQIKLDNTIEATEILRQENPTLRKVIYDLAEGRTDEALKTLRPAIHETGLSDGLSLAQKGIVVWQSLRRDGMDDPKVIVATNAMRHVMNTLVRTELVREGSVDAKSYVQDVYVPKTVGAEQLRHIDTYSIGQSMVFFGASKELSVKKDASYQVVGLDRANNRVLARGEGGKTLTFRPDAVHKHDKLPYAIYDREKIEVAAGDRLYWKTNDPTREIINNKLFEVLENCGSYLRIRHENGKEATVSRADPILRHTTYAYALTAHGAQGMTHSHGISVFSAKSGELTNASMKLVMASRFSQDYRLVTDNVALLFRKLADNDGLGKIAMEHIRQAVEVPIHELAPKIDVPFPEPVKEAVKAKENPMALADQRPANEIGDFSIPRGGGGKEKAIDRERSM